MRPFIDGSGKVAFADPATAERMNIEEAKRRQGEKAAQQRAIQSIASRGSTPQSTPQSAQEGSPQSNFIERTKPRASAPSGGNEFAQASTGREARLDERRRRPGESQTERDTRLAEGRITRSKSKDGLTDNQRSKIYGRGSREYEMSKAGINPQTGGRFEDEAEDRRRESAYDDARIESLSRDADPTKLQQVQSQVQALMKGLTKGPDGETLGTEDLEDIQRRLMLRLLAPTADQYSSPFSPTFSSTKENT
jgi:hypothetical protein